MTAIRVLVADDDTLVREALSELILADGSLRLVGAVPDGEQAVSLAARYQPDVALLDVKMAGGGHDAASQIRLCSPQTKILAFTAYADRATVLSMMRAGASGYLVKGATADEILTAIHRLVMNESILSPGVAAEVVRELSNKLETEELTSSFHREQVRRIQMLLDGGRLRSVLQPIVDLSSGRVVGAEALLRVEVDPRRPPDVWFAEAAAVELHVDLELAALRLALAHAEVVPDDVYLSVNLAPASVMDRRILAELEGVAPSKLVVEITEHAPVDDYESLAGALREFRRRGGRLAVDDAGAGYASLRHILRLTPDIIKIDISLTRDIHLDRTRRALAAALISFAEEIGASIVAEGIETQAELDALRGLGVGCGQGYFLGRPGSLRPGRFGAVIEVGARAGNHRRTLSGLREKIALIELLSAAIAASDAPSVEEALQVALDRICGHTGWAVGHACLVGPGGGHLVSSGVWYLEDGPELDAFRQATERIRFELGVGLPGRVLETRSPVLDPVLEFDPRVARADEAEAAGLVGGFGFPLLAGDELLGVLEFFSGEAEMPGDSIVEVLAGFGSQVGRVIHRKRTELEVAESRSMLALSEKLAHIGSWRTAPSGELTRFSEELCRVLGYSPDQLPRTIEGLLAAVHPDDRDRLLALRGTGASIGGTFDFECRIQRPDGDELIVHGLARPRRDPGGGVVAVEGTLQDVTGWRHAEQALREEARKLQLILDSLAEGVVVADAEGRLVHANPAATALLGIERSKGDGGGWRMGHGLLRPGGDPVPPGELPLARAIRGERVDPVDVVIVVRGEPASLRLSVTGRPLIDEDGTLRGGVIVVAEVR